MLNRQYKITVVKKVIARELKIGNIGEFRIILCNVQAVRPFLNGQTFDIHYSFSKVF